MNTSWNHGSATIYQFPVGGRAALNGHRDAARPAVDLGASRITEVAVGGSWYHEEAIQKSLQDREH